MQRSESYLDIVWRQFCKNRFALVSLWLLIPLFLMGVFAPALASDQPFVFVQGGATIYPWFRALFTADQWVDFSFNMALVAFPPCLALALAANWLLRRRGVSGRRRLIWALLGYLGATALLCGLFSLPALRLRNIYFNRTFAKEAFDDPEATALFTPIPFGPTEQNLRAIYQPPMFRLPRAERSRSNEGFPHLLGTDNVGRDVAARMIHGMRISLTVGFIAVGLYLAIGIVVGAAAGYFGGVTDLLISRIIEIMLVFPSFFLILALVALIGPSIYLIMFVIGVTGWPGIARLIRGEVLKQRSLDYVSAARALGASHGRIIGRHILPNALSPALVAAPFGIAGAIITEAGLSLLGFGVPPPAPSWGTLLNLGSHNYAYWWLVVVPSVAIFFTVTVFNLVGSGLRDAIDPRLRM